MAKKRSGGSLAGLQSANKRMKDQLRKKKAAKRKKENDLKKAAKLKRENESLRNQLRKVGKKKK